MVTLPEEVERLAVVDIRNVHVNHHTHGQVVHVLVRVLINIHVVEQDIVEEVERLVMENMKAVGVQLDMSGKMELV